MHERVFLGLGSNLGDRAANLHRAHEALQAAGIGIGQASPVYETAPWGNTDQPPFLNQVLEVYDADPVLAPQLNLPGMTPADCLRVLLAVEQRMGRQRTRKWGPRVIDLDLLAFGNRVLTTDDLRLPHPGIAQRAFVLVPWADIAPGFVVPGLGQSVAQLRDALPAAEQAGVHRWA